METISILKIPGTVYCGPGSLARLQDILVEWKAKAPALFTDKGVEYTGLLDEVLRLVQKNCTCTTIIDDLPAEPTYSQVQRLVDDCRRQNVDCIIAVGGGSVMDTAKIASVLLNDFVTVKDLLSYPIRMRKCCPTLMIPTTLGTGSEATSHSIVTVPERHIKVSIAGDAMMADAVILDPSMVRTLPTKLAVASCMDALTHAIECYTSNNATPISDTFALQALDMILNNILPVYTNPEAVEAKSSLQLASFYAGVAVTASGTAAVHAFSSPLGGKYHLAHGISNAILLIPVMRFNAPACQDRLAAAYDRCVHQNKTCTTRKAKAEYMLGWLETIVHASKIPMHLQDFGIPDSDLRLLVEAGMQTTSLLNNNPRPVTADDARAIYSQAL